MIQPTFTDAVYQFPNQKQYYSGKVREVYIFENQIIMIASDRLSAFDVVLPKGIPFKGQVLNEMAAFFLNQTQHICPNWLQATPDPNVSAGIPCQVFKIEMIVRGYLAGHAWRLYRTGARQICGVKLPDGLKENDALPQPIITPSTKAEKGGQDVDISKADILKQGLASAADYALLEQYSRALFDFGQRYAAQQNLILVDTKYEFGKKDGQIYLIDEIHTPDSSRYFYADGFEERQASGEKQKHLSKEFVREWLIENEFQGLEGQIMPIMPNRFVESVSDRYIELFEQITGKHFKKADTTNVLARIEANILTYLKENPEYFQNRYRGIRILLTKKFPYSVHYLVKDDTVFVLKILHQKQFYR